MSRTRRLATVAASVLLGVTGSVVVALPAAAAVREVRAYALVLNHTAAVQTIGAGHGYNSTGGSIEVRRESTGQYAVSFNGSATDGGVAHVVAYKWPGRTFCTVVNWGPGFLGVGADNLIVRVRCYSGSTGALMDSPFSVDFTTGPITTHRPGRFAYFWADQVAPTGVRTINHPYVYDSVGGPVAYERLSTGRYRIHLQPGLVGPTPEYTMIHVTAYGSGPVHCQFGGPGSREVQCVNVFGVPVDSRFSFSYGYNTDILGRTSGTYATFLGYGSQAAVTDWIAVVQQGTLSPRITTAWGFAEAGAYRIEIPNTTFTRAHVIVSAVRSRSNDLPPGYCRLGDSSAISINWNIEVNCFDYGGHLKVMDFRVSITS